MRGNSHVRCEVGEKLEITSNSYLSPYRSVELELELEQKNKKEMLSMVQDISNMVNIHYIRQKEPKGLGHAVHCAKSFIGNEPFAVLLGDDIVDAETPCLKQMINAYDEYKTSILGVQEVARENVDKYGILDVKHIEDRVYKVKDMVEKPSVEDAPSNIAILGRYIITPEIFNILENQEPGKGGEIQLTDALQTLATKEAIYAYNFEGRRYDVGDKLGFLEATVDFALKRPELRDDFIGFLKSKAGMIREEENIDKYIKDSNYINDSQDNEIENVLEEVAVTVE